MELKDSKEIAELISAFLILPLPVYLVENYLKEGNPIKICGWIKQEIKPGITYPAIDILEKVISNFNDNPNNHQF